ncbi:MAG: hypothetical protein LBG96_14725 [Tannerella sp.]|jgi:hypothetical protein|nr:hypothetical protein [Tannerella sp.]
MISGKQVIYMTLALLISLATIKNANAQDDPWQESMRYLQYSPRYFGPSAFPIPELRSGYIETRWEVELRGEYHECTGDRTKDIYARAFIPIAKGCAGFEVSYILYEYYNTTLEIVEERHAAGRYWKSGAHGDVIVSFFYKLLKSDKWADIMIEATLKTASGNRLADARFTDAASYWFNMNTGRDLYRNADRTSFIRLQGLVGFYCWMTNEIVHRQNDALAYSAGISSGYGNLTFHADMAGFYGYKGNGDRPLQLRTKVNYEYQKNILSFRYKHGIKDYLYDTFSLAYIRCF